MKLYPLFVLMAQRHRLQPRLSLLVLTYGTLVVLIHCLCALFAQRARRWLGSERGGRGLNQAGGATFVFFGAVLASAQR